MGDDVGNSNGVGNSVVFRLGSDIGEDKAVLTSDELGVADGAILGRTDGKSNDGSVDVGEVGAAVGAAGTENIRMREQQQQ